MKKPELLAPAGNFEKLKIAIHYGADAVYIGGVAFSLRAKADNFTVDGIKEAASYAKERGVKVYVVANAFLRNEDIQSITQFLKDIKGAHVDGLILTDPGALDLAREIVPEIPIHLSTQANTTNLVSARFWGRHGVKRVIIARELSLQEIAEIKRSATGIQVEAFVHGAMCISYSGRCLLSSFMAERDSNRGFCAHPCRWNYYLVEEKRPGEYFQVIEDDKGTYVFNSKDLCMIEHIPELVESGVDSLKIEGRMKGINYVASTVSIYRKAIDAYCDDPAGYTFDPAWQDELMKVSHRGYTTGFFLGSLGKESQNYASSAYIRSYDFVGVVKEVQDDGGAIVQARNKLVVGDRLEVFTTEMPPKQFTLHSMKNNNGVDVDIAQPLDIIYITFGFDVRQNDLIRRKKDDAPEKPLAR